MQSDHPIVRAWRSSLIVQYIIMALEFIVGVFVAKSSALTGDAFHMVGDVVAGHIGLHAEDQATRPADEVASYGYARWRDISFIVRATIVIFAGIMAIKEAIGAWLEPERVTNYQFALGMAVVGLIGNLWAHHRIYRYHHHHQNVASFAGHLWWDAASSVLAIVALLGAWLLGLHFLDGLAALIIGIGMITYGLKLWRNEAVRERMLELTPNGFPLGALTAELLLIDYVFNVDPHLHLTSSPTGLRLDVCLHADRRLTLEQCEDIRSQAVDVLHRYGVTHPRVELRPEHEPTTQTH